MSLPMTSGAWRIVQAAAARRWRPSSGASWASSPTSRKRAPGMAFRGDLQPLDHHDRRVVAAHGVHRQCVGRGQGRTEATPRPGVRPGQRPSAHSRRRPPRARHRSRNGCRRGAAAAVRRSSGIRRGPRAAAPGGCAACRARDGEVFLLGTAMGLRPSGLSDALRSGKGRRGNHNCQQCKPRRLAEGRSRRKAGWGRGGVRYSSVTSRDGANPGVAAPCDAVSLHPWPPPTPAPGTSTALRRADGAAPRDRTLVG